MWTYLESIVQKAIHKWIAIVVVGKGSMPDIKADQRRFYDSLGTMLYVRHTKSLDLRTVIDPLLK